LARIKTDRARKQLHRLWLLEAYASKALRVESVMSLQTWFRALRYTWNDVQKYRAIFCENIIRKWDPNRGESGEDIYYDFRTKKRVPRNNKQEWKPLLMKNQIIPRREVCKCNVGYVTRWCIQCKTLECETDYIKRHGPDDLEDDLDAAELLGTASFRMEVPMHRHGWCVIPGGFPIQKFDGSIEHKPCDMCETCHMRVGSAKATDAEGTLILLCRECKATLLEADPDASITAVEFRTRHRGMDDLDSDEEGAYDNWPTPRPDNGNDEDDW
tara:strand:+ start:151 stop:963 length:813 start_codon:yes stop_codon:yes gene_type:complete